MVISSASLPELSKTLVEESDRTERDAERWRYKIDTSPVDPLTDARKRAIDIRDLPGRG